MRSIAILWENIFVGLVLTKPDIFLLNACVHVLPDATSNQTLFLELPLDAAENACANNNNANIPVGQVPPF